MNKYLKTKSFSFFLLAQPLILIFLLLSFLIKDQSLIISFYLCIFILCCISYYSLYCICKQITLHAQLAAQNALAKHQQEFQENYLLASQAYKDTFDQVKDEIYRKIDTYKNIEITNEEQAREFSKKIIQEYSFLDQIDYCSNKIIDAILYNKLMLAKSYQIKTSVQVIVPETIQIKPIDIMAIYTNLLDNAIEACLKIDEKERFIEINSMIKSNYLIIKNINSKDPSKHIDLNNLKTSKLDQVHHGLGSQIIKKTCDDNNGALKIIDNGTSLEAYATLQLNV